MRQFYKGLAVTLTMLVAGIILNISAFAANPAANPMQQLATSMLKDIGQTTWISEGKGPHVIYIFFDPNCPYCHKLYVSTRDWVKAGKVELRWIPVGILMPTSAGKAVAMLGAEDPLKAFYQNEEHYDKSAGFGAIDEDIATPAVEKKLKANENLLERTRFGAVPIMLFDSKNDGAVLVQGAPPKDRLENVLEQVK